MGSDFHVDVHGDVHSDYDGIIHGDHAIYHFHGIKENQHKDIFHVLSSFS